ncbi:hypothetical protein GQ44DRAFT_763573 [Phaeosphaeriaceae sp. PMI808]|nr:hypothetical protein GQ44DRAFT_763573 [Phaeosphaeriaceae sp. PMI808]
MALPSNYHINYTSKYLNQLPESSQHLKNMELTIQPSPQPIRLWRIQYRMNLVEGSGDSQSRVTVIAFTTDQWTTLPLVEAQKCAHDPNQDMYYYTDTESLEPFEEIDGPPPVVMVDSYPYDLAQLRNGSRHWWISVLVDRAGDTLKSKFTDYELHCFKEFLIVVRRIATMCRRRRLPVLMDDIALRIHEREVVDSGNFTAESYDENDENNPRLLLR